MLFDGISHQVPDTDPGETEEWLDSFDAIVDARGRARARYLLMKLLELALASEAAVSWRWVKGHSGDRWNDRVDELATQAADLGTGVRG